MEESKAGFEIFDTFLYSSYEFYGVNNDRFCIGRNGKRVILHIKSMNVLDGSCLSSVDISFNDDGFSELPLCKAKITHHEKKNFVGYVLTDTKNRSKVLLRFGTQYNKAEEKNKPRKPSFLLQQQ